MKNILSLPVCECIYDICPCTHLNGNDSELAFTENGVEVT